MNAEGDSFLWQELGKFLRAGDRVLEVGAGSCSLLHEVVEKFKVEGYGVDPFIWNGYPGLKCFQMRGEELSKLGLKFDLIYLIRSFHHLDDPSKFAEEARKVLAPGGKLLIVDWKKGTNTGVPEYYYSLDEVETILREQGFNIIESRTGRWNLVVVGEVW